jgi:hypothetical protein
MSADPAQHFEPVHLGQLQIKQHNARQLLVAFVQVTERLDAIVRRLDAPEVVSAQAGNREFLIIGIVLY